MIEFRKFSINTIDNKITLQNIKLPNYGHIVIFGSNGSGKSTLAKSIMNLKDFTGEIYIGGRNNREIDTGSVISYLPEHIDNFFITETVYNEFLLAGSNLTDDDIFAYAKKYRIYHLINRRPHKLSGGEKIRLAYALMEVRKINVLLIDEPLVMNDIEAVTEIKKFIQNTRSKSLVIECTTDIERLFSASAILYINNGILRHYNTFGQFCRDQETVAELGLQKYPIYWLGVNND